MMRLPHLTTRLSASEAQILWQIGVRRLRLLTNKPRKIVGLQGYGLVLEGNEGFGNADCGGSDFLDRFFGPLWIGRACF